MRLPFKPSACSSAQLAPILQRPSEQVCRSFLEVLIPILYLKGISTGEFEEALVALLGRDARGLSASTITRLKEAWSEEHARWSKRDLAWSALGYFARRRYAGKASHREGIHLEEVWRELILPQFPGGIGEGRLFLRH